MKQLCAQCNSQRAKRTCRIRENREICPICCATSRSNECSGCQYFAKLNDYQLDKYKKTGEPSFFLKVNPEQEEVIHAALAHLDQGRTAQAEGIIQEAEAMDADYYLLHFARGVLHIKLDQPALACACLDRAIARFPVFMEAHHNKAIACQLMGDIPGTVESFRQVVAVGDAQDANVIKARSFLVDFEKHIRKTEEINLDVYLAATKVFNEGVVLIEKQEWEKAVAVFEKCSAINPINPKPYASIGLCLGKLGRTEEAIALFDKAIALDPHYEPAILNRATLKSLGKGEILPAGPVPLIEYAKEYQGKNRSLLLESFRQIRGA